MKYTKDTLSEFCSTVGSQTPQPTILVGMGTCGVAAGAKQTYEVFQSKLGELGLLENITLKGTGCLGLCYSEPTVEVRIPGKDPVVYGNVKGKEAEKIISEHLTQNQPVEDLLFPYPGKDCFQEKSEQDLQYRIVTRNCGYIDPDSLNEYIGRQGYAALSKAIFSMSPDDVISEIKTSGIRGRGGAGFPTAIKWGFSKDAVDDQKYVVCNADEGDPGAYMDRSVLEGDPHSVLEAMAIAGYTVGANQGFIYIRAEYPLAIDRLNRAIDEAKERGLLGDGILGSDFSFDIELRLGAGAFVCGEETALLASIEGKRGMPVPRPPFPAVKGLWGKPTVINNVETYANIPMIVLKGGTWYSSIGTEGSKGTKVFAVTGKVRKSGLIEVPMGTSLRDIVFKICGGLKAEKTFKAAQTGGPSGGCIVPQFLDTPIDYESLKDIGSMMGSGGMIIMDEDDCMIDVTKFYLEFTVDESCGKCAPCRIGGRTCYNILDRISKGTAKIEEIQHLKDIGKAMNRASLCGLGQTAPNPFMSTLKYFEEEYSAHINDKVCPAGKCKEMITFTINEDCGGCTACVKFCPVDAISGEKKGMHTIDQDRCIKCGRCVEVCKRNAVIRA